MSDITIAITEDDLNEILNEFALPTLDIADLPFGDTETEVKDYIKSRLIWPAMREYYRCWPLVQFEQYSVDTSFSIDFPSDEVFNIVDIKLNTNTPSTGVPIGEPFIDGSSVFSTNYRFSQQYGTPYSYGMERTYHDRRAEYNALKISQGAFRQNVDVNARTLTGYTNVPGRITVGWAKYSFDFSKIPFEKKEDVFKLARANIFRAWGNQLSFQSNLGLVNALDPSFMIDRADELHDQVIERWNAITKVVIQRNR